ncbi:ABC transporter substrate-binding protein [Flavobacterium sp. GA093]|uniref:ABC transporter substrate-binding protein n=1 Tax=Flavobacterium hydrocarbonoxydans TaxID=2683249 RepID=A0A6I4NIZ3_9FLAO|nr:triple tyrosine motif-containing protein [Flavobacterium hydrocarbonoxydans]MWB94141.1 ABC transporter substrate-binding protein [Flavobacterium hydrocarbonoxydans]
MMKFIVRLIFISILFTHTLLNAQIKKVGVPFITNYTPKTYQAASENWDVLQNSKGMLFFANHFGVMQFDGVRWSIVTQPANKSMVRSLAIDQKDKIYLGAQGDFGYTEQQQNGQYHYTSLVNLLPKGAKNFGDVLHTVVLKNEVIFFSNEGVFLYKNNKIKVLKPSSNFDNFYEVNKEYFVLDRQKGLMQIKNESLVSVANTNKFAGINIRKIFKTKEGLLLLTQKEGLFIYKNNQLMPFVTEADYLLKQNQISVGISLSGGYYAIGTRQTGIIIIDKKGQLIQHIDKQMGLQNEYVTNLKVDKEGNLWVTLKEGIALIQISSALSRILDSSNAETKIYCSKIYQDKLYIATDNGLYWLNWQTYKQGHQKVHFKYISGMSENVWNLGVYDGVLLAFEKNGIFEINGDTAKMIAKTDGAWQGVVLPNHPDLLLVGSYSGLYLLKKINQSWVYQYKIKGFRESSRVITIDKNENIWVAHGYKGIFKLKLNKNFQSVSSIEFYDQEKGFPSSLFLNTFKIKDQIFFGTTKGVYKQDVSSKKMVSDPFFKKYLGMQNHIRLLKSDDKNTIWYVSGENTGKINSTKDGKFRTEELPFRKLRYMYIPGFENIQTTAEGDVLFGTQDGLIHYNSSKKKNYQSKYKAVISEVKAIFPKDSLLFSSRYDVLPSDLEPAEEGLYPVLSHSNNALHFSFSSLWYDDADATKYEYWLEGFEPTWSDWTIQTEKEYTNLPENEYVFHIRAKNIYDVVSEEAVFRFEILPPWYRTKWAFLLYLMLFGVLIYAIIKYQKNLAEQERDQLILKQEKELLRSRAELNEQKLVLEQQNMAIVRENLEATINLKNAKVASNTVNLIHLNEILLSIKELISQIDKKNDPNTNFGLLTKINRIIDHELQGDKHWNEFEEIFNQLHDNFMQRLKASFPELTPRDMRLCAYLRMNFNTKEIAPLLGISVRGVEDTRYRIRKKLQLSSEANITEFILNF